MKNKTGFRAIVGVICALMLAGSLAACGSTSNSMPGTYNSYVPSAPSNSCVRDDAGVLSDTTESYVNNITSSLADSCGAEIGVLTVDSTGGLEIEDYAYSVFNSWGIGSASKNNGVLLLLVTGNQDDYWCMQGSGLENSLPTSTLSRILNDQLEPSFAARDYDTGVQKTVSALAIDIAGIYGVNANAAITGNQGTTTGGFSGGATTAAAVGGALAGAAVGYAVMDVTGSILGGIFVFIIILVVVLVIISILRGPRGPRGPRPPRGPRYWGGGGYWGGSSHHSSGGFSSGGFGSSGGHSSGGFGSFGGGSSHGGGFSSGSSHGGGFSSGGSHGGGFGGFSGGGSHGGGAGRGR